MATYCFSIDDQVFGGKRIFPAFHRASSLDNSVDSLDNSWNLILVNRDNYIPDDYDIKLTVLSNGERVDSRIYPYLQDMFDNARKNGIYPVVGAGFRTHEKQQSLLDQKIKAYQAEGHSKSEARKLAKKSVALPDMLAKMSQERYIHKRFVLRNI